MGICKNAGKTTVLNGLLAEQTQVVAATSIGRDGEKLDLVTSTPKPEIFLTQGTLCATAEKLLPFCSVTKKILASTNFTTPLGRVIIFEAQSAGFVQLAGPSIIEDMQKCRDLLFELGARRVFIDGAVSRLSSVRLCGKSDGVILCSGASFSENMEETVGQTGFLADLLTLPTPSKQVMNAFEGVAETQTAALNQEMELSICSNQEALEKSAVSAQYVLYRGVFGQKEAKTCLAHPKKNSGKTFVLDYGQSLLIDAKTYALLNACGTRFACMHKTKLLAVAFNPYSARSSSYDKEVFKQKLTQRLGFEPIDFACKVEK